MRIVVWRTIPSTRRRTFIVSRNVTPWLVGRGGGLRFTLLRSSNRPRNRAIRSAAGLRDLGTPARRPVEEAFVIDLRARSSRRRTHEAMLVPMALWAWRRGSIE